MSYHAIKWLKELPLINRFHAAKDYEAYVHIDTDAISRCEKFNKPSVVIKDIFVVRQKFPSNVHFNLRLMECQLKQDVFFLQTFFQWKSSHSFNLCET
eukprot:UN13929